MTWSALQSAVGGSVLATFGESVTLPSGAEVLGVFDPQGRPAAPWGSEVGLVSAIAQQANPRVSLAEADAAALALTEILQIRGADYAITRLDPDGAGLVSVSLMPAGAADGTVSGVWR